MTMQEMLEVANNAIEDNDSGFAEGFITANSPTTTRNINFRARILFKRSIPL